MAESRRERNRLSTATEIKNVARALMAREGAGGLSLRAIAREMGMTAPAIYRYFPSRDDLVTALLLDAFDSISTAIETADAALPPTDYFARVRAIGVTYRTWAKSHPAEYALILGTPIPGYHAPFEVTQPAAHRGFVVLANLVAEILAHSGRSTPAYTDPEHPSLTTAAPTVRDLAILGWAGFHGLVSLELFGQLNDISPDLDRLFDLQITDYAHRLGLGGGNQSS